MLALGAVAHGVLTLGCGSDVVDEDGGGAAGGATAGTGAAATAGGQDQGGGTNEGGGAGTAAIAAACSDYCEVAPQCTNDGTPCTEFCAQGAPEGCAFEYAALAACVGPHTGVNCSTPSGVCVAEREAFLACAATAPPTYCSGGSFSQTGPTCETTGHCVNGQTARISCSQDATGITCQCFADEELLGECAGLDLYCDWSTSCCRDVY